MTRSDGSLAPVTYLFGSAPVDEPAERVIAHDEPAQSEPQWAVPGVEYDAGSRKPAQRDEPAPPIDDKQRTRAHNVGLHALAKRGQSVAEMTQLLERRELDPEAIAAEIKRLKSVGLLDDFALAETLVRTLAERKGLGRSGITAELRRRKIDAVAIDAALGGVDEDDELARAIEVASKRAQQLRSYDAETAKRRLGSFLQRRGYSGSVLSAAMSAALQPGSRGSGPRFE